MYRDYVNPQEAEENAQAAFAEYCKALDSGDDDWIISTSQSLAEAQERVNFAWQDDEFEEDQEWAEYELLEDQAWERACRF